MLGQPRGAAGRVGVEGQRDARVGRRRLDVHGDDPTVAREGLAEAQREVERLAEQQHQIGLGEDAGGAAQPRIVQAARALDRQRRRARRLHQPLHGRAPRAAPQRRPGENQRPLGLGQPREHGRDVLIAQGSRAFAVRGCAGSARGGRRLGGRGLQHVAGKTQVNRPRPSRGGQRERARDVVAHARRIVHGPRGLRHRPRGGHLVDFLEGAAPALRAGAGAGEQDDRRLGHARTVERRQRVEMPGAGGDQRDTRLLGEPPPRVRHVDGRGLVARVDERDAAADRRIEDREDLVARQREEMADAGGGQRLDESGRTVGTHAGTAGSLSRWRRPTAAPSARRAWPDRAQPPAGARARRRSSRGGGESPCG